MSTAKYTFTIKQMSPQLKVADLERAIDFYTSKLGFNLEFRFKDFYAGLIKDGYSIHLKITEQPVIRIKHDDDAPLALTFVIDDIQATYKELLKQGVEMVQPLREMPYGMEFYIADPDQNVIAFFEN